MLIMTGPHNNLQYLPTVHVSRLVTSLKMLTTPQFLDKVFPELIHNADGSTTAWQTKTASGLQANQGHETQNMSTLCMSRYWLRMTA